MTNHHVIETKEIAEQSFAEFYYEADKQTVKVKLRPEKLFITSPYLGFFDVHCLIQDEKDLLEVEVPSFKGDKRFADIGFWNIENFNNSVNQQRITDVAKIVTDLSMDVLGIIEVENSALEDISKEEMVAIIENTCNCNVEHIVPQAWFNHNNPMKGDLHHLFTCEKACNQFRDDDAYYDFPDYNPESNVEKNNKQLW
ncbi:endonuclease [Clostridium sp. DJ247]|uniref:endonuclease n=1 Tax=Clostridium sp. DJ247 TaxID=2726188 RepID=UPI001A9C1B28|nr:endonuclease [Clostridium sp. DJ247]